MYILAHQLVEMEKTTKSLMALGEVFFFGDDKLMKPPISKGIRRSIPPQNFKCLPLPNLSLLGGKLGIIEIAT